jgi:creatinine amidohydrolase
MDKIRYEEMLPHEIVARRGSFPAAFVGLGTLEYHGEHLAVGLDGLKAGKLCALAAARSGGFAFPTLWYGEPRVEKLLEAEFDPDGAVKAKMGFDPAKFALDYYGKTGEQQVEFYQALIYHLLIQMNTLEMKAVCLLGGHYPLARFARPVVERFNGEYADTQAFVGTEVHYPVAHAPWGSADIPPGAENPNLQGYPPEAPVVGGDHAAKWESSYLWHLRPDCVDLSVYLGRESEPIPGVIGQDPRTEATVEIGRRAVEQIVTAMIEKAAGLLARAGHNP